MERVYELSGRLDELHGGNRNANIEPGLDRVGEELGLGLPEGGDPQANGVFIVSKVAVEMTVAQADSNMCRWIVCTTERVT
jgi:hypothetical protein